MKRILVVGGGTAGSIIAKNLSEKFDVTVFEKSSKRKIFFPFNVPLMIGLLYKGENDFVRQGEINSNNKRTVPFFYPNVLGGTSEMNGAVHVIGQTQRWLKLLRRFDFTEDDLSSSIDRLFFGSKKSKSLKIKRAAVGPIEKAIIETASFLGLKSIETPWQDEVGVGLIYNNSGQFLRSSVSTLNPFKFARIKKSTEVDRLLIDDNKIIGVKDIQGNEYYADCVILASGVVGSSKILHNTGKFFANTKAKNLMSAGAQIKDHPNLRVNVKTKINIGSLNEINASLIKKCYGFIKHFLGFETIFSGTGATIGFHLDLDKDGIVDTRLNILRFYENGRMGNNGNFLNDADGGFSFSVTPISPVSIGSIDFDSEKPIVNAQHLKEEYDLEQMRRAVKFSLDFLKQQPLEKHVRTILRENELLLCSNEYMRKNCYSGYHLIGGTSHLVNRDFELRYHENCFVCDASIMADYVSSNIHASVVLMADMFSQRLLRHWDNK